MTCAHCGSDRVDELLSHRRGATYRCARCGGYGHELGDDTDRLYDRDYFERNYEGLEDRQVEEFRWCVERIRDYVSSGAILDYGCGTGVLLRVATEMGFGDNVGVDVSEHALRIARRSGPPGTTWVHLPGQSIPARTFAVVTFMNSLTALRGARETVQEVRDRHLAPGGVLVIRSPNVPARYIEAVARFGRLLGPHATAALLFAKARHILFDTASLPRFLHSLGFEVALLRMRADLPIPIRHTSLPALARSLVLRAIQTRESMFVIARRASGDGGGRPPA